MIISIKHIRDLDTDTSPVDATAQADETEQADKRGQHAVDFARWLYC